MITAVPLVLFFGGRNTDKVDLDHRRTYLRYFFNCCLLVVVMLSLYNENTI